MNKFEKLLGPWRITFDTNPDDCNLHCIMCERHSEFSHYREKKQQAGLLTTPRRMPIDLISKTVEEAVNYGLKEIIPSTMGEPLLYRNFEDILEICIQNGVKLNLTTNGTFPKKSVTKWAKLIAPICSDIKVSWNGATRETSEMIMKGSSFDKAISNVKEFIRIRDRIWEEGGNRCRITFQMTFMERNYRELPDIIRLAAHLGVDRVKGHHLWVNFPETEELSMRRNPDAINRWNKVVKEALSVKDQVRLPNGKKVLLENIWFLDGAILEVAPNSICPFLGQEAWVSAKGRFDPCCAPDELRRGLGDFGYVNEQSIMEIWRSEGYNQLCKNYKEYPLCQSCNMRRSIN